MKEQDHAGTHKLRRGKWMFAAWVFLSSVLSVFWKIPEAFRAVWVVNSCLLLLALAFYLDKQLPWRRSLRVAALTSVTLVVVFPLFLAWALIPVKVVATITMFWMVIRAHETSTTVSRL